MIIIHNDWVQCFEEIRIDNLETSFNYQGPYSKRKTIRLLKKKRSFGKMVKRFARAAETTKICIDKRLQELMF